MCYTDKEKDAATALLMLQVLVLHGASSPTRHAENNDAPLPEEANDVIPQEEPRNVNRSDDEEDQVDDEEALKQQVCQSGLAFLERIVERMYRWFPNSDTSDSEDEHAGQRVPSPQPALPVAAAASRRNNGPRGPCGPRGPRRPPSAGAAAGTSRRPLQANARRGPAQRAVRPNGTGQMIALGNGAAKVPEGVMAKINWDSYTSATRHLLIAVFPRRVLATHSLTGKPSPAFMHKPAKKRLDPNLVEDIVLTVVQRCGPGVNERLVRKCIATKCMDEAKMLRNRLQNHRGRPPPESDQENIPPPKPSSSTSCPRNK